MVNTASAAVLSMRPSRSTDGPFLQSLYQSARPELQWIAEHFPDAMHYVVEKLDTPRPFHRVMAGAL